MRCVFSVTGAFLGRVDGETRCAFWAEEPVDHDFDPGRLIEVDLARTPSAAASEEIPWDAVEVDDCITGPNGVVGGTTLGPRWPEMQMTGLVYLERAFVAALPPRLRPPSPPVGMGGQPYEGMTTVYRPDLDDPRAGRRYAGHCAEILEERGTLAWVAVHPQGRSDNPDVRPLMMWIDLASSAQCDAGPHSLTTIGVGDAPKRGALFLVSGQLLADPPHPEEQP
jgi:hypothetical protein